MSITGGCLCGQLRYEVAAEAPIVARILLAPAAVCRRRAAAANAAFEAALTATGERAVYESVTDSGAKMRRSSRPTCGTPVFSESEPRPGAIVVRVGTLDDPEIGRPSATIWTAPPPSWACIDAGLPSAEKQAPPPQR